MLFRSCCPACCTHPLLSAPHGPRDTPTHTADFASAESPHHTTHNTHPAPEITPTHPPHHTHHDCESDPAFGDEQLPEQALDTQHTRTLSPKPRHHEHETAHAAASSCSACTPVASRRCVESWLDHTHTQQPRQGYSQVMLIAKAMKFGLGGGEWGLKPQQEIGRAHV